MRRRTLVGCCLFLACSEPQTEPAQRAETVALSPTAPLSAASAAVAAPPSASSPPDVSYPDDPAPTPSSGPSASTSAELAAPSLHEVLQDYTRLAASLRGRQGRDGVRLREQRPDGALARIGLKQGDVVKDINGFRMDEPDAAVDAYAKLRRARRFDIHIVRDGKAMTVTVEEK